MGWWMGCDPPGALPKRETTSWDTGRYIRADLPKSVVRVFSLGFVPHDPQGTLSDRLHRVHDRALGRGGTVPLGSPALVLPCSLLSERVVGSCRVSEALVPMFPDLEFMSDYTAELLGKGLTNRLRPSVRLKWGPTS